MKFNAVTSLIALAIVALLAFGLYSWCRFAELNLLVAIFGGVACLLTLGTSLGISFEQPRKSTNIKVLSSLFFTIFLISNVVFCCLASFSVPVYVIINGVLLLLWFLSCYGIAKA